MEGTVLNGWHSLFTDVSLKDVQYIYTSSRFRFLGSVKESIVKIEERKLINYIENACLTFIINSNYYHTRTVKCTKK